VKRTSLAVIVAILLVAGTLTTFAEEPAPPDAPPPNMAVYYLALLHRGSAWTSEPTPEVKRLLEGHMAKYPAAGRGREADPGRAFRR